MSKKRKGRGIDHSWQFVQYLYDSAIYARCSCGFHYPCYKNHSISNPFPIEPDIHKLYYYCPLCGSRKKWYNDNIIHINKSPWDDI